MYDKMKNRKNVSHVYTTSYCSANNIQFYMHLMFPPSGSNLYVAFRRRINVFFKAFTFFGFFVWENWHVERNMRFRIIIMSAVKPVYAFSRVWHLFSLLSPGRALSSIGKFQATNLPDVLCYTFFIKRSPFALCVIGTRLGSSLIDLDFY